MAFSEISKKHQTVFDSHHMTVKKAHTAPGITDFNILKPISRGAFGQVYLAQRNNSGKRLYAIKAMKKSDVRIKNMMDQVYRERDALAISSKCPFIVQLYYSFQSDEKIYLVMEYMIGGDLKSLLHNMGFFNEVMSTFYIAEVVLALDYLHSHSIFHRDIKPDNMLLSNSGHVKLTDFGLSYLTSERKPNFLDLINTPNKNKSDKLSKIGTFFWRTPGQLQSLTSTFTFSAPKLTRNRCLHKSTMKGNTKQSNRFAEFVFSPPQFPSITSNVLSLSTPKGNKIISTPNVTQNFSAINGLPEDVWKGNTGLTTEVAVLNLNNRPSKRSFTDAEDEEEDNEIMLTNTAMRKRIRIYSQSLPSDLEISQEKFQISIEANQKNNVVTFNDKVYEHKNSLAKNENSDIFHNQHDQSSYVNISGVTALTENSHMNISCVADDGPISPKNIFKNSIDKYSPSPSHISEQISEQSPSLTPISTLNRERRGSAVMKTPVQTLRFVESPSLSACNSILHENLNLTPNNYLSQNEKIKSNSHMITVTPNSNYTSESTFYTPKQTSFKTPKSCLRGKTTPAERRRVLGTPDYLAPEILLGKKHGSPVDWWALGICFYEFLTGIPPFNDDTPELVFQHILDYDLIWPEGDESLSEDLVAAITHMLTIDPDERPQANEIKIMKCFHKLNWQILHSTQSPFIPQPDDPYDTTYFDARLLANKLEMSNFEP